MKDKAPSSPEAALSDVHGFCPFCFNEMKFFLGVTNNRWFDYINTINPEDINFWQPGGQLAFKAIPSGSPFLFKLKSPYNAIGGLGFFSNHIFYLYLLHGMYLAIEMG